MPLRPVSGLAQESLVAETAALTQKQHSAVTETGLPAHPKRHQAAALGSREPFSVMNLGKMGSEWPVVDLERPSDPSSPPRCSWPG